VILGGALALAAPRAHAVCIPSASSGSAGTLTLIGQINATSCWAASGEMISQRLGKPCTQCDQLKAACAAACGSGQCCTPFGVTCSAGGFVNWAACGFTAQRTSDGVALTWDQLREQLGCKTKPVSFSWHWAGSSTAGGPGAGGHMMVAARYSNSAYGRLVYVYDPDPVGSGEAFWMPYTTYVQGAHHTHWSDDYNIAVK
jgi:hypothetical protein